MAGLQYKFFPTDFFVPTFEPTVVDSSPKAMSLINSNHQIEDSSELPKSNDTKFNNNKFAKLSLSSSVDSTQRSITPVTKKN